MKQDFTPHSATIQPNSESYGALPSNVSTIGPLTSVTVAEGGAIMLLGGGVSLNERVSAARLAAEQGSSPVRKCPEGTFLVVDPSVPGNEACIEDQYAVEPDGHVSILKEAEMLTHGNRRQAYGQPIDDYSRTAAMASGLLRDKLKAPISASEMAMIMVLVKLSRQINKPGRDNMVDAAGYAWVAHSCAEAEKSSAAK